MVRNTRYTESSLQTMLNQHSLTRRQLLTGSTKLAMSSAIALTLGQRALSALAQEASPVTSMTAPLTSQVIAAGLINPRFIAFGDNGVIYVSEAGTGGDETITSQSGDSSAATPVASALGTRGTTGQVSQITPDGVTSVVASGLPSYVTDGPVGPAGIAFGDGQIWLAIGGAGPLTPIVEPLPNENTVVRIDPASGEVEPIANIGAYEVENNPQTDSVDSNLYGLARSSSGTIVVADAGGNALYSINSSTNELSLLGVFPDIQLAAPEATPVSGTPEASPVAGPPFVQTVPTGVAISSEGAIYIGELTGAPFIPGVASVLQFRGDGTFTPVGTGLTMVSGVAVGPDGNIYATELSVNFLGQPPAPGRVVRIDQSGNNEVIADNLAFPNGIAFDQEGNLFVVVNTVGAPGAAPNGQIIRFDGVAQ